VLAVVAVVGGLALPANAYDDACAGPYYGTVTSVKICVDVNGPLRTAHLHATSTVRPTTVSSSQLELWQYSPGTGTWLRVESGPAVGGGTNSADAYGSSFSYQYGHSYQACSWDTKVSYGVLLSESYGYFCSLLRDN
jgi:hypothetical protein